MTADYDRECLVRALRALGLSEGDVVLTHASVGMLGVPAEGLRHEAVADLYRGAFAEVLGADGVWLLPAFTYSWCRGETFDPRMTPPLRMGVLAGELWQQSDAHRSLDPIFSVVAFGGRARDLVSGPVDVCFGADSVWARLLAADAVVCNIGLGSHSTLIHHLEWRFGVPYRYPKVFAGAAIVDGRQERGEVVYHVRSLEEPAHEPDFSRVDVDGRRSGAVRASVVGRGEINAVRVQRLAELVHDGLAGEPGYLVAGPLRDGQRAA